MRLKHDDVFPAVAVAVAVLVALFAIGQAAPGLARNLTLAAIAAVPLAYASGYYRWLRANGSSTERAGQAALYAAKVGVLLMLPVSWGLFYGPYGGLLGQTLVGVPMYLFFGGSFGVFQLVLAKLILLPIVIVAADWQIKSKQSRL